MNNFYHVISRHFSEISAKYGKADAAKLVIIAATLSTEGKMEIATSNARAAVLGGLGIGVIPPAKNNELFTLYDRRAYKRNRYGMLVKR